METVWFVLSSIAFFPYTFMENSPPVSSEKERSCSIIVERKKKPPGDGNTDYDNYHTVRKITNAADGPNQGGNGQKDSSKSTGSNNK